MPNYGTTTITVTGPEQDRAALRIALGATAYGEFDFSLMDAAPDLWCGNGLLRNADLVEEGNALRLRICMAYDADCLLLAGSLSRRYLGLHFEGWFDCEGTWPEFTAAAYSGGTEIYHVRFATLLIASLVLGAARPHSYWAIAFYQRTPEHDLAAAAVISDRLEPFLRLPAVIAGWRRSNNDPSDTVYLLPDADDAGHLVLAFDTVQEEASLLRNVNNAGGYSSLERVSLDQVRTRWPELVGEVDRLVLETAANRMSHPDWRNAFADPPDSEVAF